MSQLDLMGGELPVGVTLTERQAAALAYIRENQPVASDELGAYLHELRRTAGGRGHPSETRCVWCTDEGRQMLRALRRKRRLVKQLRGIGWVTRDYKRDADATFGDFPKGF